VLTCQDSEISCRYIRRIEHQRNLSRGDRDRRRSCDRERLSLNLNAAQIKINSVFEDLTRSLSRKYTTWKKLKDISQTAGKYPHSLGMEK